MPEGTLRAIIKQADIDTDVFQVNVVRKREDRTEDKIRKKQSKVKYIIKTT